MAPQESAGGPRGSIAGKGECGVMPVVVDAAEVVEFGSCASVVCG